MLTVCRLKSGPRPRPGSTLRKDSLPDEGAPGTLPPHLCRPQAHMANLCKACARPEQLRGILEAGRVTASHITPLS